MEAGTPVPSEKSYPDVMVQPRQDWDSDNDAGALDCPTPGARPCPKPSACAPSLSDKQVDQIKTAALPVPPHLRSVYLQHVADALAGCPARGHARLGPAYRGLTEPRENSMSPTWVA